MMRQRMQRRGALFLGVLLQAFICLGTSLAGENELSETGGLSVRSLIVPVRQAVLAGEIAARISRVDADIGDTFKAGQPLVILDTRMYRARTQRAEAEFRAAQKSLAIHEKLAGMGSMSDLEILTARARLEMAAADLDIERIQTALGIIKAPFGGRVVKRLANPHEYVTPGQPLVEIIDRELRLQLHVPSAWLSWLKPGVVFQVAVDETGKRYPARITRLGAKIDPVSQTIEVLGRFTADHQNLVAGMSGMARFPGQKEEQ